MKRAQELFDSIENDPEGDKYDAAKLLAEEDCKTYETIEFKGVFYDNFYFADGSKLTFGRNGYVGAEF